MFGIVSLRLLLSRSATYHGSLRCSKGFQVFLNSHFQTSYLALCHNRQVLLDAAYKVGVEGARELLDDPKAGLQEVH